MNYDEDYEDYEIDYDDYGSHYGDFSGTYAQDVEGYSDDAIYDAFDGDPEAYWNIDWKFTNLLILTIWVYLIFYLETRR